MIRSYVPDNYGMVKCDLSDTFERTKILVKGDSFMKAYGRRDPWADPYLSDCCAIFIQHRLPLERFIVVSKGVINENRC